MKQTSNVSTCTMNKNASHKEGAGMYEAKYQFKNKVKLQTFLNKQNGQKYAAKYIFKQ
ncbi:hypothetical protein PJ95_000744 [Salmonella enterica subsp. enterica]|uniref:hypothetical protein n=1 Tax=Salmonella enterica TaxID=28901 RepID=UPI0015C46B21|nr:hypothetical protein [Salmonella enterica]EDR3715344.1 hypothetical protein [Salmonella enterica subsp. enterica serovar Abony]EEG4330285.1 hypothetical protein [Salmonella enterica subsp. enterica]EFS6088995.1 hypothetical protein [Salmonella enterica subsp. enterica serovar Johannesburg]EGH2128253.1 hypothetical protein [Salmonella enterica subsp. enterica serovar Napoli]EGZ6270628.1 hypothetical protein [Salmonella enterica subsp. enterica serovar 4,[5],12:b:-]EHX6755072.1 hypothetical 